MKEKLKGDPMKVINEYAGSYRHLITLGRIIAAVSAILTLVPFYDILYSSPQTYCCSRDGENMS